MYASHEETFEERPGQKGGGSHVCIWRRRFVGRRLNHPLGRRSVVLTEQCERRSVRRARRESWEAAALGGPCGP